MFGIKSGAPLTICWPDTLLSTKLIDHSTKKRYNWPAKLPINQLDTSNHACKRKLPVRQILLHPRRRTSHDGTFTSSSATATLSNPLTNTAST